MRQHAWAARSARIASTTQQLIAQVKPAKTRVYSSPIALIRGAKRVEWPLNDS
jgi:hypothetical protein